MTMHDWKEYTGKPVIIKGCGDKRIPKDAYVLATQYLKPVAKKISYGEACSAVPLK
jgi:S-adenosylmethionine/arginine decarboxylase-like enzyme